MLRRTCVGLALELPSQTNSHKTLGNPTFESCPEGAVDEGHKSQNLILDLIEELSRLKNP